MLNTVIHNNQFSNYYVQFWKWHLKFSYIDNFNARSIHLIKMQLEHWRLCLCDTMYTCQDTFVHFINRWFVFVLSFLWSTTVWGTGQLKCDGIRAETRFRLSAKRTSQFKSAGASVQSTTGSRGVRISGSNAGYTMLWGSVKSIGYLLHSTVSPSLPLPCVTVCHHISSGLYLFRRKFLSQM